MLRTTDSGKSLSLPNKKIYIHAYSPFLFICNKIKCLHISNVVLIFEIYTCTEAMSES